MVGVLGPALVCGIQHNAPILSGLKAFHHLFEQSEVMIMRTGGEFTQCDGCMANVRSTGDVSAQQFTK